jgi:diacylglycerol kinase (ATP)
MADGKRSFFPRGPAGIWKALVWSLAGLRHAYVHESSFRLQAWAFVPLAPLALVLGTTPIERAILLGSLLMILATELLNSSMEALADKLSPGHDELVGRAKDMGSAAVFVMMLNALACWALILWPRFVP